jgi:hypothetical protein
MFGSKWMRGSGLTTLGLLNIGLLLSSMPASAESWDFSDRSLALSVADEGRTAEEFHGTKITLEGRFFVKSVAEETSEKRRCCVQPSRPEHFYGLIDASLRWGIDGTGLEYVRVGGTPWATRWEPEIDNGRRLRTTEDLLEFLAVRYIADDPLGVDGYLEISLARVGRAGVYRWSRTSPFTVVLGAQASAGFAWADSQDPQFSRVDNPFAGLFLSIGMRHDRIGEFYSHYRFVNGFSFSNPSRGHPTVREALTRLGLLKEFKNGLAFDLYFEKRSFYFDEGGLPALYTEAESVGARLTYSF